MEPDIGTNLLSPQFKKNKKLSKSPYKTPRLDVRN